MKNDTVRATKMEEKTGFNSAAFPWREKGLIAQNSEASFPASGSQHIHYCSKCGCVLISTAVARQYATNLCPECSDKIQTSQGGN